MGINCFPLKVPTFVVWYNSCNFKQTVSSSSPHLIQAHCIEWMAYCEKFYAKQTVQEKPCLKAAYNLIPHPCLGPYNQFCTLLLVSCPVLTSEQQKELLVL